MNRTTTNNRKLESLRYKEDREWNSLLQKKGNPLKNQRYEARVGFPAPYQGDGRVMDLGFEQYFIYAWRYENDTACKLGVSTLRTFYARVKAARTVTYQEIELLGIEVFGRKPKRGRRIRNGLIRLSGSLIVVPGWCSMMLFGNGPKTNACRILRRSVVLKMRF